MDKPLIKALWYSCLFHLLILCSFRVKMFDIPESAPLSPIAVSIVHEPEDAVALSVDADPQAKNFMYTDYLEGLCYNDQLAKEIQNEIFERQTIDASPVLFPENEPLECEPFEFQVKAYPLKIQLSRSLRELRYLEDGSSFFKEKTRDFLPHTSPEYSITYEVEIDGQTGKIGHFERSRELLDKSLQVLADRLLDSLRFATSEPKVYKGTITLTFYCTGDELQEIVKL